MNFRVSIGCKMLIIYWPHRIVLRIKWNGEPRPSQILAHLIFTPQRTLPIVSCCNVPVFHSGSNTQLPLCVGFMQTSLLSGSVSNLLKSCNQIISCFTTEGHSRVSILWERAYSKLGCSPCVSYSKLGCSPCVSFASHWLKGLSLYFWVLLNSRLLILLNVWYFPLQPVPPSTYDLTMHRTAVFSVTCLNATLNQPLSSVNSTSKTHLKSVPFSSSPLPPGPGLELL